MPKQETDIFDERGPYKMQRWGMMSEPEKVQIKVTTSDGYFCLNIDKNKPCSAIKKAIAKLYEERKKVALSYKEHYKNENL